MRRDVVLDTNLLVLLLIGAADRSAVGKHRRSRGYSHTDYDALKSLILDAEENGAKILVSPNVWTEVSNLLFEKSGKGGHLWSHIVPILYMLVGQFEERSVPTIRAVRRSEFHFLGVSDTVLLEIAAEAGATIVTDDAMLALEASRLPAGAVHFAEVTAAWDSER